MTPSGSRAAGATVSNAVQTLTASQSSNVQVGNNTYNIQLPPDALGITIGPPASAQAEQLSRYSYKSIQPVATFVPRPILQDEIREQLQRPLPDGKRGTNVVVVAGLSGAGKTQLVLSYMQKYQSTYKAIFWIEAEQQSSVDRDCVNLYHLLFNVRLSDSRGTVDAESAAIAIKSWMSSSCDATLLVLDGADEVDDTSSEHYVDLSRLIPSAPRAHVIITSRSRTTLGLSSFEGVRVRELEASQAVELFRKAANLTVDDAAVDSQVRAIVEELGYLALAVSLAGTYISQTPRLSAHLDEYLTEYRQRRRQLMDRKPGALLHQYGESVMTTWETSFAAICRRSSDASRLLTLLAFLDNNDIFLDLFCLDGTTLTASDRPWLSAIWEDHDANIYKLEGCFHVLESFCLVQQSPSASSYAMHKLVNAWGRDRLFDNQLEEERFCFAAFLLLAGAISQCSENPRDKLRLVPQLMANFAAVKAVGLRPVSDTMNVLGGLTRVARFVHSVGQWTNTVTIERFILEENVLVHDEDHPDTLSAMNNLAATLRDQGKLSEAAAIQTKVREKMRRILGDNHPDTLTVMSNLAATLKNQGKLSEAAAIQTEVLDKRRQILGNGHPDTLTAISNLAATLKDQGKLSEAAAIQTEMLEKRRRILGNSHPDTLSTISNLAAMLKDQGKLSEAVAIQTEVVDKWRQILGNGHPDTLTAMGNLAAILGDQGKLLEAAAIQTKVLEKMKQILGDGHPHTITTRGNLQMNLDRIAWKKRCSCCCW